MSSEQPEKRRGPGRPPKSGAYSTKRLQPLTKVKHEELMASIKEQNIKLLPGDEMDVLSLARTLALLDILAEDIDKHGIFMDDAGGKARGTISPSVSHFWTATRQINKLCDRLGLTAEARMRLSKNVPPTVDLATQIQQAKES